MKKIKSIISMVLTITLLLPLASPFAEVTLAAEESGTLSGWTKGATTTDLSGNAEDGYHISFSGYALESNGTSYESGISVDGLQVHFNLSGLAVGQSIVLQFADAKGSFERGSTSRVNVVLNKSDDTTLVLYGTDRDRGDSSAVFNYHKITSFDFRQNHVIEFVENGDKWEIALDGSIRTKSDTQDIYTMFVTTMLEGCSQKTVVSFAPNNCSTTIQNIKFSDATGWIKGATTTLTGTQDSGWNIEATGGRSVANITSYEADVDVSKLQVHFNLENLPVGKSMILQFANATERVNSALAGADSRIIFVLNRSATNKLFIYGFDSRTYNGSSYLMNQTIDFAYEDNHVIGFARNTSGKWIPTLDGVAMTSNETFITYYDTFVKTMLATSPKKTYVNFLPLDETSGDLLVENIQFTTDSSSNWIKGTTTTLTGNADNSWNIAFYGSRSVANITSYEADISISKLQVRFNLNDLPVGKAIMLQFADEGQRATGTSSAAATRMNFFLERHSNKFRIYGYDSGGFSTRDFTSFDFTKDHAIGFVKKSNGTWDLAIDGVTQSVSYVNDFVNNMLVSSPKKTYVNFIPHESGSTVLTVKNLSFKEVGLSGNSVVLDGTIGVKYYMSLGADVVNNISQASMKFTLENGTVQTVTDYIYDEEQDAYVYTCQLPAKHMADVVKAQLYVNGVAYYDEYRVSVKEYANKLLNDDTQTSETKSIVTNMLHYGAFAQTYFQYNTDALANEGLKPLNLANVDQTKFNDYKALQVKAEGFGEIVASNLNLKSGTSLNLYLDLQDTIDATEYTFKCGETVLEQGEYNGGTMVTVPNIGAHELDSIFTITAEHKTDTAKKYEFQYSVYNYVYNALDENYTGKVGLKDLMKALYRYNEAADGVIVLQASDFGAVADGVTDDVGAIKATLNMAKLKGQNDTPVIVELDTDKSYYFEGITESTIFDITGYSNFTLSGNDTTIIMDKTMKLRRYVNIYDSEDITIRGFNYKFSQPFYTFATVGEIHKGTADDGAGDAYHVNETDPPYMVITTERSLGITETYTPDNRTAFGLPYTENTSRCHMYIDKIEVVDASNNQYKVYFQDWADIREYMGYIEQYDLEFMLGIPYWDRGEKSDGAGSFVAQNSTDITMENLNVWASTAFVFHMRMNYGEFRFTNCNVTTEPGQDDAWAAQVDIFHLKENRCKFIIEDSLLEKAHDDVFNISTTALTIDEVYAKNEFNMYCDEFDGVYYMPLKAGDTITIANERGRIKRLKETKIKEVVQQSGTTNRIIIEDSISWLEEGVVVYVNALGQPDSIIRNCIINGTYRLRTSITVENCEMNTMYGWISNIPGVEGPVPKGITFKNCVFNAVKAQHSGMSYVDQTYMMQIGIIDTTTSWYNDGCYVKDIVFEDCEIDPSLINTLNDSAYITFVKDGEAYKTITP